MCALIFIYFCLCIDLVKRLMENDLLQQIGMLTYVRKC